MSSRCISRSRAFSWYRRPFGNHSVGYRRNVSTAQATATNANSLVTRAKNISLGTVVGASVLLTLFYVTDTRAGIHQWLVVPSLRWIYPDAEDAHVAGTKTLKALYAVGLHPRERGEEDDDGDLTVEVFGHTLQNPLGTSAGIDKHADIPDALFDMGAAVVELGGITPYPQDGNPRTRVFRIPSQKALINRYGLNSEGAEAIAMRLRQRVREYAYAHGFGIDEAAEKEVLDGAAGVPPGSLKKGKLLAVQVAKNRFTPDDDIELVKDDYVYCVNVLAKYADIIVVNVSSPNTPGLRDLQRVAPLTTILQGVVGAAKQVERRTRPAVMVKVSPDEDSDEQIAGICQAIFESGVDGVIVGNTTKRRPKPIPSNAVLSGKETAALLEQGGYSGPQLLDRTVKLVRKYRESLERESLSSDQDSGPNTLSKPSSIIPSTDALTSTNPKNYNAKVIFATGGITNGGDLLQVLRAGADLGMTYTAMVYGGAGTITRMKNELRQGVRKKA